MSQTNGEWVQAIARRAVIDSNRLESILAAHHISPSPVLPSPRRLLLVRIAFSGVKDKLGREEPFSFDWSDLDHGLWAILSDQNFRGKSTITETDEDAEAMKSDLEQRVRASKAAYEKAAKAVGDLREALKTSKETSTSLRSRIDETAARLGSYQRQQELGREIAVLEGRLAEANRDDFEGGADHQPDEMRALAAIVVETENRVKAVRDDLLKDVSSRIVHYAQRFGMHALTGASLKANAALSLVKGGTSTSYSKVTDGEKLRLKVATVLAMLEIGEQKGVGRHPGLLMIDSPGAQEVSQADLDALVSGLQSVAKDIPHCQIFVAGRSSEAITDHVFGV